MKLNSLQEARDQFQEVQSEMEQLADNLVKNVDRETSLERLNELNEQSKNLSMKLENSESDGNVSLFEDVGLDKDTLEIESTLGNAIGVIDAVLQRVIQMYIASSDAEKTEIAKHIAEVKSLNEISTMKPTSGRGVRLTEDKIIEIRENFQEAWNENPYIKLPRFMEMYNLNMQAYSLTSLIKGKTYVHIGGPIRGIDYDTEERNPAFANSD